MVIAVVAIILGRALQGAGDTMAPMIITLITLWGLQVPLAVVLSGIVQPAVVGIWWAVDIATVAHGVMIAAWFQTGRWKHIELLK